MKKTIFIVLMLVLSMILSACAKEETPAPIHVTATPTPYVLENAEENAPNAEESAGTANNGTEETTPSAAPLDEKKAPEDDVAVRPDTYPVVNPGDIMNDPFALIEDMTIGWNLGNTFDANSDVNPVNEMDLETAWSGIKTTREMIQAVNDRGFKTIRIPISWHNHVDEDFNISEQWLNRIQEVVDYAYELDMYVIINTHHDVYPQYYYPLSIYSETSNRYMEKIWSQVAERFKDYDEHLIFESLNEPRLKDTNHEWTLTYNCKECMDAVECINEMNQTFVNTVRAAGGKNENRYLMVPGYDASPEGALNDGFRLPEDTAENKIIVSVHAYTPYWFALADPKLSSSTDKFDPSKTTSTNDIKVFMKKLYEKFIANGVPVLIGEFGSRNKNFNNEDRVAHAHYYVKLARSYGMSCCWWDNNAFNGDGENFGLLSRSLLKWRFDDILDALMEEAYVFYR